LGGQSGQMPSQPNFASPRTQFGNVNMLGNYQNGASNSQRGLTDNGSDPLSTGNGMGYTSPSSPFVPSNIPNSNSLQDHQQQQHEPHHNQQFSVPSNNNNHQYQAVRGGLAGIGPVKIESQLMNEQQNLRNLGGPMKMEPQQMQSMRNMPPVKMEATHNDQSLFIHQQQQQQLLQMSRQSPQAAATAAQINLLQQQRFLQMQQQQQILKANSQQRSQFQHQSLPLRPSNKGGYEPGMCARKLTQYMYRQQHRPEDNNIEFWRTFVTEYFTPNAKKKWCVSMYGSGRQTTGVFPQDVWHCEICNRKPGRGFEATAEVLPRLFKIKYESGTQEELLYVDMPREYQNSSGQIVLDYAKAIQESVFEQLRVVRDGQLRLVFSPDLKICSWEFCARRHEELIPRRLLVPQISQLGAAAQKYQASSQNGSSSLSVPELQSNCNMFIATARQLAKALEVPLVNDLGYTKRYVRCLQISEVVNSMKDLIDYSDDTGTGPMESLTKYPRRTPPSSGFNVHSQSQPPNGNQQQNLNTDNNTTQAQANGQSRATTSQINSSTLAGLLNPNSMNQRQQNPPPFNAAGGVHAASPGPASTVPNPQPSTLPAFHSPAQTPSSSNNHLPQANSPSISGDPDMNDSQSSVQKIINEMMMSSSSPSQVGNEAKNVNGPGFGSMGNNGLAPASIVNGIRTANGRVGMGMGMGMGQNPNLHHQSQQHDLGNGFNNLGNNNGFNNLQFDWKSSP
jgi:hypothetical protein